MQHVHNAPHQPIPQKHYCLPDTPDPTVSKRVLHSVGVAATLTYLTTVENGAAALGLSPIGESGSQALAVGVHADLPEVVIKVVSTDDDAFYDFALAVLTGELKSKHYPKIYSITKIYGGKAVVLMERMLELLPRHSPDPLRDAIRGGTNDSVKGLADWACLNDMYLDLHRGNFMRRTDGTIVVIDPVWFG